MTYGNNDKSCAYFKTFLTHFPRFHYFCREIKIPECENLRIMSWAE
jgi:hypothetical protein